MTHVFLYCDIFLWFLWFFWLLVWLRFFSETWLFWFVFPCVCFLVFLSFFDLCSLIFFTFVVLILPLYIVSVEVEILLIVLVVFLPFSCLFLVLFSCVLYRVFLFHRWLFCGNVYGRGDVWFFCCLSYYRWYCMVRVLYFFLWIDISYNFDMFCSMSFVTFIL